MTTTIVLARTDDGYLGTANAVYATARNALNAGSIGAGSAMVFWGQRLLSGDYGIFQAFIGFTFSAVPADELVTAAYVRVTGERTNSPATARNLVFKGQAWPPLAIADFLGASELAGQNNYLQVNDAQNQGTKKAYAGSQTLIAELESGATSLSLSAHSSRSIAGNVPTVDENSAFYSGANSGTSQDPRLVYTTVQRHSYVPVLGASVLLSDGSRAYLTADLDLFQMAVDTSDWDTAIPTGVSSSTFDAAPEGAQGFALAVDASDNVYVIGRAGNNSNAIAVKAYLKNPSSLGWTSSSSVQTYALPTYPEGRINNLAAAWHDVSGGTLLVVASHSNGNGISGGAGNDVAYILLSSASLQASGGAAALRGSGTALGLFMPATAPDSDDFNGYANETGTGLDVVADHFQADWGYVWSFRKGARLGENDAHAIGRYILNGTGTGFSHTSTEDAGWGVKDASAKARIISIGNGQVAALSVDEDSGWGLTVIMYQATGTTPGFSILGHIRMDDEGIVGFPAAADMAASQAWDAVYSSTDNKLYIYYVSVLGDGLISETSVDLDTYQATGVTTTIVDHSGTVSAIYALRAPRGGWAGSNTWLEISGELSGGGLVEYEELLTYNVAPTAPTLTPKANFDATAAATFAWTFNDPNPGDTQSAYELEVMDVSDSSVDIDTGKVASATSSRNVTGGTLTNGKSYQWRVKTWDAADVEGAWSDWAAFSTSAGGAVTVTSPSVDNEGGVITDDYLIAWNVTGTTQASYRVILTRTDTGATVSDSGWVTSVATTHTISGMVSDVEHQVSVQVRNAGLVASGIGLRLITPSYSTPEVPLITVTPLPELGYTLVSVENPIPGQPVNEGPVWDFEGTFPTGWPAAVSATWAQDAVIFQEGTKSAKLTVTGTPVTAYQRAPSTAVVAGERYTCRFWAYRPVAGDVKATIDWRDASDVFVSTSQAVVSLAAGIWTLVSVAAFAPAGAAFAQYGPTLDGSPATGTIVYVDELAFVSTSDRPDVTVNKVLRRRLGSGDAWEIIGEAPPDGSFQDYTADGWVPLEYMVRGES